MKPQHPPLVGKHWTSARDAYKVRQAAESRRDCEVTSMNPHEDHRFIETLFFDQIKRVTLGVSA